MNENFTRKRRLAFRENLFSQIYDFQKFRDLIVANILRGFNFANLGKQTNCENFSD